MWDVFGADRAAAVLLRSAIEGRGAFDGLRACHRAGADGRLLPFELYATVRSDALDRFAGHIGTARPCSGDDALHEDRRVLKTLLDALPAPVFLLAGPARRAADAGAHVQQGAGEARAVVRCNAAARRLAGLAAAEPLPAWDSLSARLPTALGD